MSMMQTIADTFSGKNAISIRDATVQFLGAMLFRQVLLSAAGAVLVFARINHAWQYAAAGVLLFVVVAAYGQIKGWLGQRDAKRMADALPDDVAVVVRKGEK